MAETGERALVWVERKENLAFRFGRYYLARVPVRVLSLENPCTDLSADIDATLSRLPAIPPGLEGAALPAHPVDRELPRLRGLFSPVIQYVSNSGPRQLVCLRGTFAEYSARFSRKRRHELNRMARRFQELSGGTLELKLFRSSGDILTFQSIATTLSRKTYKATVGAAFEDLTLSPEELQQGAAEGTARGYVLYFGGRPAAYGFFRAQGANLLFVNTAYDPEYAKSSPGTVFLWLVLQSLFGEQRFAYLDFLWGRYPFKQLFATTTIEVAAVFCLRNTLRNKLLILSHYASIVATRLMLWTTHGFGLGRPLRRASAWFSGRN